MAKKGQHVIPSSSGRWAVRKAGSARTTSFHATQSDAIEAARKIARNQKTALYIHGQDGRIETRDSCGNDPQPPKG